MTYEEYKAAKQKGDEIYAAAKHNKLTNIKRWEEGRDHHPKSIELMTFLQLHDLRDCDDYFDWNTGGDGDNGETFMFQLDAYFEQLDIDGECSMG